MPKKRDKAQYPIEAFRSIREQFRLLPIFKRQRDIALYNYVAATDFDALLSSALDPAFGLHHSHRRMVESSTHAIPAIFTHCDDSPLGEQDLREDEYFDEANELYEFGYKFDLIRDAYELADRGQFRVWVAEKDPRITFTYAAPEADQADTRLRALESLSIGPNRIDNSDETSRLLIEELRPLVRAIKRNRCDYEYSERLIEIAGRYGRDKLLRTNSMQLPEDIRLGDVTVGNLRSVWAAMMAICEVHIVAHYIGDEGVLNDLPINTIVLCKSREEFTSLISNISGLSDDEVSQILGWYTYTPQVSADAPILQPFLPLSNDILCLPSSFVNGNNFERNFRKLVQRHPSLMPFREDVRRHLEPTALGSLSELFPAPKYRIRHQVEIPEVTDADLVVFEFETNITLVIQHKWLIGPDFLRESISNDEELSKGVYQAVRSCRYLRDNPDFIRSQLDLPTGQEISAIEGVVICRGLGGTGFLDINTAVPIVTENAFSELVRESTNLGHLWHLLNTRPDMSSAEKLSSEVKTRFDLCGFEFVIPGLAVQFPERRKRSV